MLTWDGLLQLAKRVCDGDPASGQVALVGTSGELHTRGYSVMLGYWGNADATRRKTQKFVMREQSTSALGLGEAAAVRTA